MGLAGLVPGCGTVEESRESLPPPPPVVQQKPEKLKFETRTDTVYSKKTGYAGSKTPIERERQIRFMVQIGAFKDPQKASEVQLLARERYRLPVLNDFHPTVLLYQIRIGFFETRKAAYEFRERMHREFPDDYNDAWVVQLKR
jgi:cell division septation protein DedD